MDYAKFRYYILCEDRDHFHFIRGWLQGKGVDIRKIIEPDYLPLASCAKDYVKRQFTAYRQKIRAKAQSDNVALIVVMDADNNAVSDCCKYFPIEKKDPIFVVIPKWSIETWAGFLITPDPVQFVNEDVSCKIQHQKVSWGKIGKQLAATPYASISKSPSLKSTWDRIRLQKDTFVG